MKIDGAIAAAEVRESTPFNQEGKTVKAAFLLRTDLPKGTILYALGDMPSANLEIRYANLMYHLGVNTHFAAIAEIRSLKSQRFQPEKHPGCLLFSLDKSLINNIQVHSISQVIPRARVAHHTDFHMRINGQNEVWEADWVKHLVPYSLTPSEQTKKEEIEKFFTSIPLGVKDRMLRFGFGKNKGRWFVRLDLWSVGFRIAF